VIRARPFNHIGPGQALGFVVSALAQRIAEAERAGTGEIRVGNLDASRDFTDVRDVVRAYRLLGEFGDPGEAYNVASGVSVPISTLLDEMIGLALIPLKAVADADLLRPKDQKIMCGDAHKLMKLTGWKPEIPRSTTLRDILEHDRAILATTDS
jgi:GDP-4-dehydro-6-deoxy-D-mannose reductase